MFTSGSSTAKKFYSPLLPDSELISDRMKVNKYHEVKNSESCSSRSLINSREVRQDGEEALIEGLKTRN